MVLPEKGTLARLDHYPAALAHPRVLEPNQANTKFALKVLYIEQLGFPDNLG